VSALSFTDRTPLYDGDALKELSEIKGKNGEIDHSTLPEFARKVTAEGEDGRDLGAMISMLVKAVQQIKDYLSQIAVLNTQQDKKIKRLEEQNILLMERLDRLESLDKNLGCSYIESTNKEPIVITTKLSPQTIIEKLRKLFN
jgi:septal ring factor EnvC (AmiA/AmiB activator)